MVGHPGLLLVSPRPRRGDDQCVQRRAHTPLSALSEDWAIQVLSWFPDADQSLAGQWRSRPPSGLRALALTSDRPLQVAYVQWLMPRLRIQRLPPSVLVHQGCPAQPGGYTNEAVAEAWTILTTFARILDART